MNEEEYTNLNAIDDPELSEDESMAKYIQVQKRSHNLSNLILYHLMVN